MTDHKDQNEKSQILEDEKNLVLNHDYDGIQELDHPLPFWWQATFYGGIIFAFAYCIYFWFLGGENIEQSYQRRMALLQEQKAIAGGDGQFEIIKYQTEFISSQNLAQTLQTGEGVYQMYCMACHMEGGRGGDIGPNLADDHWKNGDGRAESIYEVIVNGRLDQGMPAWDGVLTTSDMYAVTAYVRSLRGSNPSDAKAPEGEYFDPPDDNE